jgi:hypothetical protein
MSVPKSPTESEGLDGKFANGVRFHLVSQSSIGKSMFDQFVISPVAG